MVEKKGFVLIGAGLPRTGTMSTRAALTQLLEGNVYHMATVMRERPDHHPYWRKALQGTASKADWEKVLEDYRGGVDYPISFFYKELMEAFPDAKVLLNVRDPVKWYESVKNAIYKFHTTMKNWPCPWALTLIGLNDNINMVSALSEPIPKASSTGHSMFGAVAAGQSTAIQFWNDHVNEVKKHVPADKLLVWEVKEGWGPLCKFLDLPVPDQPFPRVNDTAEIESTRMFVLRMSYALIVFIPAALLLMGWLLSFDSPMHVLLLLAIYAAIVSFVKSRVMTNLLNHGKQKSD